MPMHRRRNYGPAMMLAILAAIMALGGGCGALFAAAIVKSVCGP